MLGNDKRMKPASLRTDFSWTFFGNAAYAGGQFAVLTLFAKTVPPEMVGNYALGLALVYPVMQFSNLQLRAVMNSDRRRETTFGQYLGFRLVTTAVALVTIFWLTRFLGYDWRLTAVVLMVGLAYGIETISDVYYAQFQRQDQMDRIAKSMVTRALFTTLVLLVTVLASRSVVWGVLSIAVARLAVLLGYDSRRRTHGPADNGVPLTDSLLPSWNLRVHAKLFWTSFPLGLVVLLGCLNSSIPAFFVKSGLGDREVGIFAAIGVVVSVGNMAVVSLGQSAYNRLARAYANCDFGAFGSLVMKLLAFGATVGVSGVVLSEWAGRAILSLLFRPEYAERADLLPWMTAAGAVLFMAQFLGFAMTAANLYHSQVILNLFANLALVAGCYWLVPRQGLAGAIFAMLLCASVQLTGSVLALATAMRAQKLSGSEVELI
jgi:O-antigen/teichoic acid export membrane protein